MGNLIFSILVKNCFRFLFTLETNCVIPCRTARWKDSGGGGGGGGGEDGQDIHHFLLFLISIVFQGREGVSTLSCGVIFSLILMREGWSPSDPTLPPHSHQNPGVTAVFATKKSDIRMAFYLYDFTLIIKNYFFIKVATMIRWTNYKIPLNFRFGSYDKLSCASSNNLPQYKYLHWEHSYAFTLARWRWFQLTFPHIFGLEHRTIRFPFMAARHLDPATPRSTIKIIILKW